MLKMLFPPRCVVCDGLLEITETGVHALCREKMPWIDGAVCMHCGRPVYSKKTEYCEECDKKRRNQTFRQGKSLFLYQEPMKNSMYRFKYANRREYGAFYAKTAWELQGEWLKKIQPDVIVPVPMFGRKKKKRGYNQAEIFARELSKRTRIPVDAGCVARVTDTAPMKNLGEAVRKNNLKNAFQIQKNIVKYRKVLLVDDIYTTGSTADAVTECLLQAGVLEVFFISICIGKGY